MNEGVHSLEALLPRNRALVQPLGIFASWRLQAYGYTLAAGYAVFVLYLYWLKIWLLNKKGVPIYHDFTCAFVAGLQALHGKIATIYVAAEFTKAQEALVGTGHALFSNWPYPPTYFLILAPLAALPYVQAFLTWGVLTLLGYIVVVCLIVRRSPSIPLALASPFVAWNFIAGQSGSFTAFLTGAALLTLERKPVWAGVFIGCLTYKPQFGILFPVALISARQWRAFASSAATAVVLGAVSIAAFGIGPWAEFPRELFAQADLNLVIGPGTGADHDPWGQVQTVYGLMRRLHGGASLAWAAQGVMTLGTAVIVWVNWRSRANFALKAATLSAGMLIATPYAFAYDLVAIAIAVAYFAKDQMDRGLVRGEQTVLLVLFATSLVIFVLAGKAPGGALISLALLCLVLRRVFYHSADPMISGNLQGLGRLIPKLSWR